MVIDAPFTSFTPDQPALNNGGLLRVHGGFAGRGTAQGAITLYPLKSAALFSSTSMASRPIGSAIGQDRDGNAKVYAGCAEALYRLSPQDRQWQNISRTTGYNTPASEQWRSVEFGSLQVFTNYNDPPQFIDMNADVRFADMTTLVKGKYIAQHKGFTILGNTYDALDGGVPYRVRWSGIEAPGDWTFSPATMADFQDVYNYGNITGIVTDDQVWVLLERGIVQMQFIGAPYAFSFTDRVTGKGCSVPESVVTVSGMHFFLSDDGFYMLQGGQLQNIGAGRVNRWFLETADLNQANLMTVAVDPREQLVYWQFVSKNAPVGKPDMILIYNWGSGEFTTSDATTGFIFNAVSLPYTLDRLDEFGTLDDIVPSFDSPVFAGGENMLFGMSETGAVYSFSGPTIDLSIETPEFQLSRMLPNEGQADMAMVSAARPLFEGDAVGRIQVGTRSLQNGSMTWSQLTECHPQTGFAYLRTLSRYQRFRVSISGEWRKAYALQVEAKAAGRR